MEPKSVKHVWIVNHHAALPSKDGRSGRHLSLAQHLPPAGWSASIIVASTSHPSGLQRLKGLRLRRLSREEGIQTLWVKTSAYGSSMTRRFVGMLLFAFILLVPGMTRGLPRPDVIIGSTVHPFAAWAASRLAKRLRVPFVYEVRDVWPEALIQLGKLGESSSLAKLLRAVTRRSCRAASMVVAPLPGIRAFLDASGFRRVPFLWVSNGVEPQDLPAAAQRTDEEFTFMYLGSHGNANALDEIMDSFVLACDLAPQTRMRLRLVGDGPLKADLKAYAAQLKYADRIDFDDRIHREAVIARAQEADCLVAKLHDHAVYKYGISPNKLFDYQLAARPVVFASTALNNPIRDARSGITIESSTTEALANALVRMTQTDPEERAAMGARGRDYVLANFTYEALAARLADGLGEVLVPRNLEEKGVQ